MSNGNSPFLPLFHLHAHTSFDIYLHIYIEPATYITTLDVLFEPMRPSDGGENAMYGELGAPMMHALNDLFTCPLGPRLRILVCHIWQSIIYTYERNNLVILT